MSQSTDLLSNPKRKFLDVSTPVVAEYSKFIENLTLLIHNQRNLPPYRPPMAKAQQ